MQELADFFRVLGLDLRTLNGDIAKMIMNKQKESKGPNESKMGLKTIQNTTTLYSSKEDIKNAKDNPELDYINRAFDRILDK